MDERRDIVIIGGGIIGCTSAYFITRHPAYNPALHKITILEATSIASGASGKAGGLLALWAYPSSIVPLSYRLHSELAAEHDGASRWGYRKVHSGSLRAKGRSLTKGTASGTSSKKEWSKLPKVDGKASTQKKTRGVPNDLNWFVPDLVQEYSKMGDTTTTAQVHPYLFTTSMAKLAEEKGAKIQLGYVTAIDYSANKVKSVIYEENGTGKVCRIPATDAILCAGPWTSQIFPKAPIDVLRAHSVTIKADVSPYAIFSEIELPTNFGLPEEDSKDSYWSSRKTVSPEMYDRPNGEVYVCGEGDTFVPLPKTSDLVECDESRCQDIIDYAGSISDELRDGEVLVKQACYLPSISRGQGPLIGQTGINGLLIATGHTCWGIQNSCATGKLISEFLFDGKALSANIETLDPRNVL